MLKFAVSFVEFSGGSGEEQTHRPRLTGHNRPVRAMDEAMLTHVRDRT